MIGAAIAVRLIHVAATVLLVGGLAFPVLVVRRPLPPKFDAADVAAFDRLLRRLTGWALLVAFATGVLGLWLQLSTATGRPWLQALTGADLWTLLTATQYGRVWVVRSALMALLGGLLWLREPERQASDWWALRLQGLGLAAAILVAQAWMGHSATGEGWVLAGQVVADGLHLLASGVWLGGLPYLVVLLSWAIRGSEPGTSALAAEATRRFSALAGVSVGVLLLTGLANAWNLVGSVPALLGTSYGRLLLAKVGLLLPLLACAAASRRRANPHRPSAVAGQDPALAQERLRRLRRTVLGELLCAGLILAVVGALGTLPPAYHDQPTWPFSFRLSWQAAKDLPGVRTSVAIGLQMSMFGGFLAALAARTRYGLGVVPLGLILVAVGFALWLPKLAIDAYPTTYLRPSVPYNAASIANGLHLYTQHCALCHGEAGAGDGPLAPGLRPRPADLTARHTADHTAGDLFWWLTHGRPRTAMPGFGAQLSAEERWDVINYIRTLAAAEQGRALGPRPSPELRCIAPDFTYASQLGGVRSLRDHRGRDQVLLVLFSLPHSATRLRQLQTAYPQVRQRGGEILALPLQDEVGPDELAGQLPLAFPLVTDGAAEVAVAYAQFRRSLSPEGSLPNPPLPPHLEFLIDRQGYLRARWIPGEGSGWEDLDELLSAIDRLNQEKYAVPAPDLHVH
jgi:putative copper resistance protein D